MNRVLGVLGVLVVSYGLMVLPAFFPGFRSLSSEWIKTMTSSDNNSDGNTDAAAITETSQPKKEERPRTPMELKFAIDGPQVHVDDDDDETTATTTTTTTTTTSSSSANTIYMDYQMGDWVTSDLIRYQFYNFDCKEKVSEEDEEEDSSIPFETRLEKLEPSPPAVEDDDDDGDSSHETEDEDEATKSSSSSSSALTKRSTWRLTLRVKNSKESNGESSRPAPRRPRHHQFCVRWMLYNLPPASNEYAVEVTFQQTQLAMTIDEDDQSGRQHIVNNKVDVSSPEPVAIKVNVNGRGTAQVVRNDDQEEKEEKDSTTTSTRTSTDEL